MGSSLVAVPSDLPLAPQLPPAKKLIDDMNMEVLLLYRRYTHIYSLYTFIIYNSIMFLYNIMPSSY